MYLKHFGLKELPFRITPDTSFVFANRYHQEALNTVLVALQEGEGFIKITGEVGTGKTLLCRRLLQSLGDDWVTAYLPNPSLAPEALSLAIAEELGIRETASLDHYQLVRRINRELLHLARARKRVAVLVDEAQAMPVPTLEALRLLSNLETEKRKLLHIVLFGQPELDERLRQPEIRQLAQRVAFHCRLRGVQKRELQSYVAHRLRVAGYVGEGLFTPSALRALYRGSDGAPRLINILAHKSMLLAFGEGKQMVGLRHVRLACKDTEGVRRLRWFWW